MRELNPDQQGQELHDKRIDVSFLCSPLEDYALSVEPVFRECFVVALSKQHPLADGPEVALHPLSEWLFILPSQHQVPGC